MTLINKKISNYIIKSEIESGGMGTVYLAEHERLGNKAAVKVLHPSLGMDSGIRNRFLSEARTLATLNHPMIVRVLDYSEDENGLSIIMEYVQGEPLDKLIKNVTGPIPEERAFRIFKKILDGFHYAHNRGIIHRDIKPSNIIIDENDNPKIIDFGIVKMIGDAAGNSMHTTTGTGKGIGTPSFMSPEQVLNRPVDARSDIFSLGLTLFCMLTGRTPFGSTLSEFEIKRNIVDLDLPRAASIYPNVSAKAQHIIDKATEKIATDRYQSCEEFKAAIDANFVPSATYSNSALPPYVPPFEPKKPNNTVSIVFGIMLLALVIGIISYSNYNANPNEETRVVISDTTVTVIDYPSVDTITTDSEVSNDGSNQNVDTTTYVVEEETGYTPPIVYTEKEDFSEYEAERLSGILNSYFYEDNKTGDNLDITSILNYYSFPVEKYYDKTYLSRSELYDHMRFYYKEKLYYHYLSVSDKSGYKYSGRFYVTVNGTYTFETMKTDERKSREISDLYIFDANYKIVSVGPK